MKPIRLWPGVALVLVQWFSWFVLPVVLPSLAAYGLFAGVACGVLILAWWLFFSRSPWVERLAVFPVIVAGFFAIKPFVDPSITGGAMGMLMTILAIPLMSMALVVGALVGSRRSTAIRRLSLVAAIVIGAVAFTTVRTAGMIGGGGMELHWRWTPTPEERLLAQPAVLTPPPPVLPPTRNAIRRDPDWPGFRGPGRDSVVRGVRINTNWEQSPPKKIWSRPIGPGWSSFSVDGDQVFTQEQRGKEEIVASYRLSTGQPVWQHRDPVRFYESNGGPGPRGTPTLFNGRVYAFGATGILNVLDEDTGAVIWSHDVAADIKSKVPMWGFSSSPLIVDDLVIVAAASKLAAYDLASGQLRWSDPAHGASYSSPQRVTIADVEQIVLLVGDGVISVAPADGKLLWSHAWSAGSPIVQPAVTPDGDILINSITAMGGEGIRRLKIAHNGAWTVTERWTSPGLKPYFNDFVLHKGYGYGFDGSILSCIDLSDGSRKWKGGRYGNGQLVLLADQDLLLVVSEDGELALVNATPDGYTELARIPGIEGKTWNHPVVVGDTLLVRNGEEMAAFKLSLRSATSAIDSRIKSTSSGQR